jgi:hypothetical protein
MMYLEGRQVEGTTFGMHVGSSRQVPESGMLCLALHAFCVYSCMSFDPLALLQSTSEASLNVDTLRAYSCVRSMVLPLSVCQFMPRLAFRASLPVFDGDVCS